MRDIQSVSLSSARESACRSAPAGPGSSPARRTAPRRFAATASAEPNSGGIAPTKFTSPSINQRSSQVANQRQRFAAAAPRASRKSDRRKICRRKADRTAAAAAPASATCDAIAQIEKCRQRRCPASATTVLITATRLWTQCIPRSGQPGTIVPGQRRREPQEIAEARTAARKPTTVAQTARIISGTVIVRGDSWA